MTRPTYMRAEDAAREQATAVRFALAKFCRQLKIGGTVPGCDTAGVDRLLFCDDKVTAFFEVKVLFNTTFGGTSPRWGSGYIVSEAKVKRLRILHEIVQVPVLLLVEFTKSGTLAFVNVQQPYDRLEDFGRDDRGDPQDREPCARFAWDKFRLVS